MSSPIFDMIAAEQERQNTNIELIASENFVSTDVLAAVGSCLTNKYAEGYPSARYYGGCQCVDKIESYCQEMWQKVFTTDYHVNVQPHSGSQANAAAYMALLQPGDTVLSLELSSGGHLSHGSKVNFSGKIYNFIHYNLTTDGYINYSDLYSKIKAFRPSLVLAGASAYSRAINFKMIYDMIQELSTAAYHPYFMVDMAHIAGLIATGDHPSPFGYADVITTTTHKTLRGPRGGLIFCRPELAKKIDSAVFPGTQGGPLLHVIAGKAICAEEAGSEEFSKYIFQVVKNAAAMAEHFQKNGVPVVTGGTDNHLFLLDLSKFNITGAQLQAALDKINITVNKNCIPNETRSPKETSGVRIGTAAMTTKGYKEDDFIKVADKIIEVIRELSNDLPA